MTVLRSPSDSLGQLRTGGVLIRTIPPKGIGCPKGIGHIRTAQCHIGDNPLGEGTPPLVSGVPSPTQAGRVLMKGRTRKAEDLPSGDQGYADESC